MNSELLGDLANALLESETLSGPALEVYLDAVKPWPKPLVDSKTGNSPVKMRVAATAAEDEDTAHGWPRPEA